GGVQVQPEQESVQACIPIDFQLDLDGGFCVDRTVEIEILEDLFIGNQTADGQVLHADTDVELAANHLEDSFGVVGGQRTERRLQHQRLRQRSGGDPRNTPPRYHNPARLEKTSRVVQKRDYAFARTDRADQLGDADVHLLG